ncbi:rRNA maturation RNase YbeY [Deferribacter thermophilus]|uniref:rRNA maturation RNase YbeY n=1 Tax=Deferribacter thermophilus TaxID=53573 RepID=UPI003C1945F2
MKDDLEIDLLITNETNYNIDEKVFYETTKLVLKEVIYPLNRAEISILLNNDEKMKKLNKEYRDKDYPTDVLSFPMNEGIIQDDMLGDIVINLDKVKEYSLENDIPFLRELVFQYIHGLLHLLGYDHEKGDEEEKLMFDLQEKILHKAINYGLCE